jgi:hypothetical protein
MANRRVSVWVEENQGKHRCGCGCGQVIVITKNHSTNGIPKFFPGHSGRKRPPKFGFLPLRDREAWAEENQGKHRCGCGCGQVIVMTAHHYYNGIPRCIRGHSKSTKPRKTDQERFWPRVDRDGPGGCWSWTGAKGRKGYGHVSVRRLPVKGLAHRLSYLIHKGEFDPDLEIMHDCDNPSCVNPDHLRAGTHDENMKDAALRGRLRRTYTVGQVLGVVEMRSRGEASKDVAEKTGVKPSSQCDIMNGRVWGHVTGIGGAGDGQ